MISENEYLFDDDNPLSLQAFSCSCYNILGTTLDTYVAMGQLANKT